jgi:hypothetical protein
VIQPGNIGTFFPPFSAEDAEKDGARMQHPGPIIRNEAHSVRKRGKIAQIQDSVRRKTRPFCLEAGQALPGNNTVSKNAGMQAAQKLLYRRFVRSHISKARCVAPGFLVCEALWFRIV